MGMRWLLGIILLAVISLVLSWVGPISAPAQSERMGKSVEQTFTDAGVEGVNVEMKGNVAHLSGEAVSEEALGKAATLAASARCTECRNQDPVWHEVKNAMTVKAPPPAPVVATVSPFIFSATKKADGSLFLDGHVRSENEMGRVMREATSLFPDSMVNDELTVAEGAPNSAWGDLISKYLPLLADLDTGRLVLDDNQSLLTGVTNDEAVRNRIIAGIDDSLGYNEVANINVPNAAPVFAGTMNSQELCQKLFDELKGDSKITFATNSDTIDQESFGLLDSLTSAAKQCPSFNVSISGHSDSTGDPAYNVDLSQRRAQRVVDYLVAKEVEAGRLTSYGLGAAQPLVSNETPEGRAANRRIEFTVTKSE